MNGPRTNQFVAPTSFITSISRRREKIESRIVFAISSAAENEQDDDRDREDDLDHVRDQWRIRLRDHACRRSPVDTPAAR